jgi:hypothetical protein
MFPRNVVRETSMRSAPTAGLPDGFVGKRGPWHWWPSRADTVGMVGIQLIVYPVALVAVLVYMLRLR